MQAIGEKDGRRWGGEIVSSYLVITELPKSTRKGEKG